MKKVLDGNEVAAYIAYAFSEASVIYPITPSSEMSEFVEQWSVKGKKNLFNEVVTVETMQSEKGVGGMLHGLLRAGTLASTFTCSQGLLLMLPSLYKISGELLPGVIHVSARSLSTNSLSIHGDHSDVMGVRQSGVIILCSSSVQEVALFAMCAHLLSLRTELPVLHFFDGFDTSHEVSDVWLPSYTEIKKLLSKSDLKKFKNKAMRNDQPRIYGAAQTGATFFQMQEIVNANYEQVELDCFEIVEKCSKLLNITCSFIDYYGAKDAETVMVSMGSVAGTIKQVVNEQNQKNKKIGFLNIHLYRPFPEKSFIQALPKTVENIIVLDRTKEVGAPAEPLLSDVKNCVFDLGVKVIGGRFGLGSKNTTPADIRAAFFEIEKKAPKPRFTLGIEDDKTYHSLFPIGKNDLTSNETLTIKTFGRGSDGAVSCNRQTAEIIGEQTEQRVKAKFWFDPRKANNVTVSELRVSSQEILEGYRIKQAAILNCYHDSYLKRFNMIDEIRENGVLLVNTSRQLKRLGLLFTEQEKRKLFEKKIELYTIDASKIAREYDLGPYINVLMQASLFKIMNLIPYEDVQLFLKDKVTKEYQTRSKSLGEANILALKEVENRLKKIEIPPEWGLINKEKEKTSNVLKDIIEQNNGDLITVKQLTENGMKDGACQLGMTQNEKHSFSPCVPDWNSEKCVQCNLCAAVCPHAAIRPFILEGKTGGMTSIPSKDFDNKEYRLQVSPLDCTGCFACVDVCVKNCLEMKPIEQMKQEVDNWNQLDKKPMFTQEDLQNKNQTLQYNQPLLEFSGACAGCGETAYVKMLTQLYGENLIIANATGCSSIWGGTFPYIPYTTNQLGQGPAWGTSLLENNAEYGSGMTLGLNLNYNSVKSQLLSLKDDSRFSRNLKSAIDKWSIENNRETQNQLMMALTNEYTLSEKLTDIYHNKHFLNEKVTWIVGGDGWAYDIDSDGIDYLIGQNKNINILILDNGSYANTGGQYTSSTPQGANVKFKTSGNNVRRKNMTYLTMQRENAYVAQICIGANPDQALKAFKEAVTYDGPSIVVAYSPCVLHGVRFNSSSKEEQLAVKSGFWPLLRFNPINSKNPLKLDSKAPNDELLSEFFKGEARFKNDYLISDSSQIISEIKREYQKYRSLKQSFKVENNLN